MEKFTTNFSMKNIPFLSEGQFILSLADKIVDFIKRIRWKIFLFYNSGMEKKLNHRRSHKMVE